MLRQKVDDVRLNRATRDTYDALSRITQAQTTGSASFTWDYEYDEGSNRTRRTKGSDVVSCAYNVANELCWKQQLGNREPVLRRLSGSSDGLPGTYKVAKQKIAYTRLGGSSTTFEYAGQGQSERTKEELDALPRHAARRLGGEGQRLPRLPARQHRRARRHPEPRGQPGGQ